MTVNLISLHSSIHQEQTFFWVKMSMLEGLYFGTNGFDVTVFKVDLKFLQFWADNMNTHFNPLNSLPAHRT